MTQTFVLKIWRGVPQKQYWEEFELELKPFLNMTSALMQIQENPVNRKGERVLPVAWEQGCLEEVCGSCAMLINGTPRMACSAFAEEILQQRASSTIFLAPLSKYPLVRDLVVDRKKMFDDLKKVRGWIEVQTTQDIGPGPKISPELQEVMYRLSTCMVCGCCQEACPQVSEGGSFIGPAPLSQVRFFNDHPTGKMQQKERLRVLMQKGGIASCGNAQNCRKVCPKKIPLTESIALMGRKVTGQALRDLLSLPDAEEPSC